MAPLTSRIRALICNIGLLLGLQLCCDAFSALPMTPIARPRDSALFRRGHQNNAGVHCPSDISLKLERGGNLGEIHAANELYSSDIGGSLRDVGKKVSWERNDELDNTCLD